MKTEDLVKEALNEPVKQEFKYKDVGKVLYEKGNHLNRIGLVFPNTSKVDTLTFIPLDKKVLSILSGNPNFKADESVDLEFDEPESENWNEENQNDEVEVFPIDEYSDKVDVKEVLAANEKAGEVIATQIKELQDFDKSSDSSGDKSSDSSDSDNSTKDK